MYFDTDTLLKYTDPKFFVTHLLWICYLLYHCKTKVFIKLFIENKGLHWSLKTERTIKCYPYLRAGKEPAKGPYCFVEFTHLSSNEELMPCKPLPFWNLSYGSDCCFHFKTVFLSEELRVPFVMLPLQKKKKGKIKTTESV